MARIKNKAKVNVISPLTPEKDAILINGQAADLTFAAAMPLSVDVTATTVTYSLAYTPFFALSTDNKLNINPTILAGSIIYYDNTEGDEHLNIRINGAQFASGTNTLSLNTDFAATLLRTTNLSDRGSGTTVSVVYQDEADKKLKVAHTDNNDSDFIWSSANIVIGNLGNSWDNNTLRYTFQNHGPIFQQINELRVAGEAVVNSVDSLFNFLHTHQAVLKCAVETTRSNDPGNGTVTQSGGRVLLDVGNVDTDVHGQTTGARNVQLFKYQELRNLRADNSTNVTTSIVHYNLVFEKDYNSSGNGDTIDFYLYVSNNNIRNNYHSLTLRFNFYRLKSPQDGLSLKKKEIYDK